MLECKDKEQAVFYLYRLYNLFPVDPRVLRPPAEEESLRTKGRKSSKRAKTKGKIEEEVEVEREAEEHGLSLVEADPASIVEKGELDCGSGDEEITDVCAKNGDANTVGVKEDRDAISPQKSKKHRRRKARSKNGN